MGSISAELKTLRQQIEQLQAEAVGRKRLSAMTAWDGQNRDSVNQIPEGFSGLIVHLTDDVPANGDTTDCKKGMNQNEFDELKRQILGTLDSPPASSVAGTAGRTTG